MARRAAYLLAVQRTGLHGCLRDCNYLVSSGRCACLFLSPSSFFPLSQCCVKRARELFFPRGRARNWVIKLSRVSGHCFNYRQRQRELRPLSRTRRLFVSPPSPWPLSRVSRVISLAMGVGIYIYIYKWRGSGLCRIDLELSSLWR